MWWADLHHYACAWSFRCEINFPPYWFWHSDISERILTHKAHEKQSQNFGEEVGVHFRGNKRKEKLQTKLSGWRNKPGIIRATRTRTTATEMPADISVNIKSRTKGPQAAGSFETKVILSSVNTNWPNREINDFAVRVHAGRNGASRVRQGVQRNFKVFNFNLAPYCGNSCTPYMCSGAKDPSSR